MGYDIFKLQIVYKVQTYHQLTISKYAQRLLKKYVQHRL